MQAMERGRIVRLEGGTRVVCLAGILWITRSGDPRDIFLRADQALMIGHEGIALCEAWEDALLRLEPPRSRRTIRLPDWLRTRHAACRPAPE